MPQCFSLSFRQRNSSYKHRLRRQCPGANLKVAQSAFLRDRFDSPAWLPSISNSGHIMLIAADAVYKRQSDIYGSLRQNVP